MTAARGGAVSASKRRERRERKREEKSREKEERKRAKSSRKVGADGVLVDEDAEADAKQHLRDYRHAKAARVGGINKESEGSAWDGSTNPSNSTAPSNTESGSTVTSDLISHRQRTPTSTPTKDRESRSGGIRKVYSTADKTANRESERIGPRPGDCRRKGALPTDVTLAFSASMPAMRLIEERPGETETAISGQPGGERRRHEQRCWHQILPPLNPHPRHGVERFCIRRPEAPEAPRRKTDSAEDRSEGDGSEAAHGDGSDGEIGCQMRAGLRTGR